MVEIPKHLLPYYEKISDLLSPEEFTLELTRIDSEFGGLLDEESRALLLLDERGRNQDSSVPLSELDGRKEATVLGWVVEIGPERTFKKREGEGRVREVLLRDSSGEAKLVLWDEAVEECLEGTIEVGSTIRVVNARVKVQGGRAELHTHLWTRIESGESSDPARLKLYRDSLGGDPTALGPGLRLPGASRVDIEGTLLSLEPTTTVRDSLGVRFVARAEALVGGVRSRLVVWGEAVKGIRRVPLGGSLRARRVRMKIGPTGPEYHLDEKSEIEERT